MQLNLDYSVADPAYRKSIVDAICQEHADELTDRNLESLADYLLMPTKQRTILTQNRSSTINKRETSLENLVSKFENGEDGIYQLIKSDKNAILSPPRKITEDDIKNIPFIQQVRQAISYFRALPTRNYIVQQAIVDLSQTQYLIKNAFTKPITFNSLTFCKKPELPWDLFLDYKNPHHISALLKNYSKLKTLNYDNTQGYLYWILIDLERLIEKSLDSTLFDITIAKIDGLSNLDIQEGLEYKYQKTYSIEYISSLFNNKIPRLIAEEAEKEELIWRHTYIEKGNWRKCNRCGQIKLLHPKFFSINNSSKTGFYSICKDCRKTKKGAEEACT